MTIYVGTSGWSYDHWVDRFYPKTLSKSKWFMYYSKHFDTVEVNMSFYRWPSEDLMKRWKVKAPSTFKYTMKANRVITHWKRLEDIDKDVMKFYDLTSLLGEKLGCHLFQLPPSFEKTEENWTKVQNLVTCLDSQQDNVIEFRDVSWWTKEVIDLLDNNNIGFCTVSGLNMPEEVVQTGNVAYFRFHGDKYATKYSKEELHTWSNKIKAVDCDTVYIYFNNDRNAYAIKNAQHLMEELT